MSQKVLLVDDEPNVLQGFKRHLRKKYDLELAVGGEAAVQTMREQGPFAVIVSDMQMPEMSGLELLKQVREMDSQTVRMMLTGNADQRTAVDAVNEGSIFRFLSKPCPPDQLALALDAALEQYRLVTAEAELLSKTLAGSVKVLTQVLSLAMPEAFGMTQEARQLVGQVADRLGEGPAWQLEIAAMLMRLGCVSVPKETVLGYLRGEALSLEEEQLVSETPRLGCELVSEIPRLKAVADVIAHQFDPPQSDPPMASRILRAVGDYQRFHQGLGRFEAIRLLEDRDRYDLQVVEALKDVIDANCVSLQVSISELEEGMVLESHIEDAKGMVLLAAGTEVHEAMIQKLSLFRRSGRGVREPICVRAFRDKVVGEPTCC